VGYLQLYSSPTIIKMKTYIMCLKGKVDTHILVPIYGAVFSQIEYPYSYKVRILKESMAWHG
jgi:hypothetical protein